MGKSMKLLDLLAPHLKAIVPLAVGGLLTLLSQAGITPDMTVEQMLTLVLTAASVWIVPNRQGN
jgi:hypothetical protein